MVSTKRTPKEIEKDFKRIREAGEIATSMRELERMTSLSYDKIKTTMSKHPIVFKKLKEQIALNKQNAKDERKRRKEAETLAKAEEKAKLRAEKRSQSDKEEDHSLTGEIPKKSVEGFVIDSSITGVKDLRNILSEIFNTKSKIILTSITINELEKMQITTDDIKGADARYILALAAENDEIFENVLIDETYDTPDDCIIQYCSENKKGIILLTSDKTMALKARMHEVQVRYLKQTPITTNKGNKKRSNSKIMTLFSARRIGNQLIIPAFQTDTKSICVCSNGIEYEDGVRELKIGDDVYIATKKPDYITFAHYKIISLYSENNCEMIYSKRIYDYKDIDLLKASYKAFINNFKVKHDL